MKFKKTMLMAFLLLLILAIGAVSAADGNETADVQAVEGDADEIGLNSSDAVSAADDDVLGVEPGTFAELQIEIEASDHSLMLGKDYEGDGGFISIAKSNFLLDGNGYTLDAKGGGVFSIVGNNVQIRNLNIVNASYNHYNMSAGGAAINVYGNDCAIVNCIMTDFSSYSDWGALYVMGDGFSLANCVLSHNSPTDEGAAVLINGNNATIIGTNFTSCGGTTNSGGAIVILGNGSKIQHCLINASSSSSNGGAIYLEGHDAIINDVSIVNSSVSGKGGAIYLKGKSGQVTYSHFENCSAEYGGAVAVEGDSCIINQCGFANSTSQSDGGALYVEGDEFVLANSVFSFNCALDDGGALSINGNNATIELNEFTSNSATGGEGTPRGGAIMMVGDDNKISLTFFTSNSAAVSGGAVFAVGNRIRIYDSFFEKNNCSNKKSMGGSIYLLGNFSEISSWFYNSTANNGGAVYVNGSGNSIRNSSFIFCVSTLYGGAIYVYGNHTVIDNSKFTNNTISTPNEHYGGGAICFEGDMANVTNSNFTGNGIGTYGTGGAILMYASSYSDLIENCTFSYNNAQFGGAIRWMYSIENVIRNCTFIGNRAEKGGAINWQHCNNDTIDSCTFLDNTAVKNGAALLLGSGEEGNHVFNIINSSFEGNEGNFSGDISVLKVNGVSIVGCNFTNSKSGYGGAIALKGTGASGTMIFGCRFANVSSDTISRPIHDMSYSGGGAVFVEFNSVEVDSCIFSNCSSTGDGGAIKWLGNLGRINTTTFCDCFSANDGGAVYFSYDSASTVENCNFINSTAPEGGAIYTSGSLTVNGSKFEDNSGEGGAAIFVAAKYTDANLIVNDSKFISNDVKQAGGAIRLDASYGRAIAYDINGSEFTNNSAVNDGAGVCCAGGAIYMVEAAEGTIANSVFTANRVDSQVWPNGGAIKVQFGGKALIKYCIFIGNEAYTGAAVDLQADANKTPEVTIVGSTFKDNKACGGAVAALSNYGETNLTIIDSLFENNAVTLVGGAVYGDNSSKISVSGTNFIGNNATDKGGAVYFNGNGTVANCNFTYNQATGSGGAIYFNEYSNSTVTNCTFANNHANNGGAIFVNNTRFTLISSSNFIKNHADNDGGAVFSSKRDSVSISYSRFTDNSAETGGAIYNCTHENCTVEGKGSQIYPDNRTAPSIVITVDVLDDAAVIHVSLPIDVEGNVTVTIDGINQTLNVVKTVNVVNGVGSVTLTGLAKGTFEATVTFDGNDKYLKTSNFTSFTVSKETPALTINADNMKPNESQTITVQLPDSATGNVTFRLYYEGLIFITKSCELSKSGVLPFNGASIEVNDLPIGSYNITVGYGGDDSYIGTSDYALFTVSPWINVTHEVIKGDNLNISIDFGNLTNMTISGKVLVYIDGEEYISQRISGSKLKCAISTEEIPLESHSVSFQYSGTTFSEDIFRLGAGKSYVPMAYEVHISPREIVIPSKLVSDDVGDVVFEMPVDSVGMLSISLNTGEPVVVINMSNYADREDAFEETVGSLMPDCEVSIKKTEDDRLIITMTFSQRKGEIGVVLEYTGDGKYSPFRKVATASVNHRSPVIIAGDLSMIYSSNRVYSVVVYGSDGKAAGGVQVSFMVNGRLIGSAFTNANGVAGIKITNAPGSYSITAKALGTGATKRLTVSHVLSLKTVKVKKSAKKLVLKATLKKVNGKYLKGKKITFKFNGKTYKAKTNKKGVAKVTVKKSVLKKLKAGKKIKYQATYLKDTVKKSAKVKK